MKAAVIQSGGRIEFEPALEEGLGGQRAGRVGGKEIRLIEQGTDFVRVGEGSELQRSRHLLAGGAGLAEGIEVTLHGGWSRAAGRSP